MTPADRPSHHRWLAWSPALILSAGILVLLLRTFAARVGHPYDLEWMEGGMLLHALRIVEGEGLYVTPSSDFIPFIYPPLYSWVLAAVGAMTELGHAAGRSISLVGTLAAAGALVAAVRLERKDSGERGDSKERGTSGDWGLAIGAAGLYLSGYEDAGSFYDLVRIDGLWMALLTWALVAGRWGWLRTAGLLLTAAYATKHTAALFGLPILIWIWKTEGRDRALAFARWSVGPALLFTAAMSLEGDGLFLTYLLGVPAVHPFVPERFFKGAPSELIGAMPWTLGAAGLVAVVLRQRPGRGGSYWLACGGLAALVSMIMRGHHGGYLNVLMPGLWAGALGSALLLSAACRRWPGLPVQAAVSGLMAWQMWSGAWDIARYSPTEADRAAGDALVQRLAAEEGEILAPWSPWLVVQAGKRPSLHLISLWDIDHEWGPLNDGVAAFDRDIAERRWGLVITANRKLGHGLTTHYALSKQRISLEKGALMPRTGWQVRPRYLYRPNRR